MRQWLSTLTEAGDTNPASDLETAPAHSWAKNGWSLIFSIFPKERAGELVPVQSHLDWVATTPSRLRATLQDKAKQHKGVQIPYVIAVDVLGQVRSCL